MAKKTPKKDKSSSSLNLSARSQESGSNMSLAKAQEAYTCIGHFKEDFNNLCEQLKPPTTPLVKIRAQPPLQQQTEKKKEKLSRNSKSPKQQRQQQQQQQRQQQQQQQQQQRQQQLQPGLLNTDLMQKLGVKLCEPIMEESPPTTYTTAPIAEYLQASIQVSILSEDGGGDSEDVKKIDQLFIRGWKVGGEMLSILDSCWSLQFALHTIDMWGAGLDDVTMPLLASAVFKLPSLRKLYLDNNPMDCQDWYMFLQEPSKIEHFSLRFNRIGCVGGHKLGHHLGNQHDNQSNKSLLSLNLSGNQLEDKGAELLCNALKFNRTLQFLDLSNNHISDQALFPISQVLSEFPMSSEELELRCQLENKVEQPHKKKEEIFENISTKSKQSSKKNTSSRKSADNKSSNEALQEREESESTCLLQDTPNVLLLEEIRYDENEDVRYMLGNFRLISLNLSRNCFHSVGLKFILKAIQFQSTKLQQLQQLSLDQQQLQNLEQIQLTESQQAEKISSDMKTSAKISEEQQQASPHFQQLDPTTKKTGPGLLRLKIDNNGYNEDDCYYYRQIDEVMATRNPIASKHVVTLCHGTSDGRDESVESVIGGEKDIGGLV